MSAASEQTPEQALGEGFGGVTEELAFKVLVVDAICGVGFPSPILAMECEKVGLADFTGNQWNSAWRWDRAALLACSVSDLQELYEGLCRARGDDKEGVIYAS